MGIVFDSNLLFNAHIQDIVNLSLRSLGFIIRSCSDFTSIETFKVLYFAFVRSRLEYASIVWSPLYKKYDKAIESVQRKFLKFLSYKEDKTYPAQGFSNHLLCNRHLVLPLKIRRCVSFVKFLHKILHNNINCSNLLCIIKFNVPQYWNRKFRCFYIPKANTNILMRSPIYHMCSIINSLDCQVDINIISINDLVKLIQTNGKIQYIE